MYAPPTSPEGGPLRNSSSSFRGAREECILTSEVAKPNPHRPTDRPRATGWFRALLWVCALVLLPSGATAQVLDPAQGGQLDPDDPDFDIEAAQQRQPQAQRAEERDTFGIFAFTVENPNVDEPFTDSLLTDFQIYDPARRVDFDYGTVGILGGAAYPLRYRPRARRGLDVGLHQFDLYHVTGRSLNYYRQQKPYTDLQFIQGSEQADFLLETKFSRNFSDGINFSLDYRRISQRGNEDQYPNQGLRNTNLATGFWIDHGGGRYDAFVSYAANTYEHNFNGGLTRLPETGGELGTPLSAEVYLSTARLRQAHRELMLTQYLKFGGRTDSLGRTGRAYTLSHQFRLNNLTNRLAVPFAETDSNFYQRFPAALSDLRGQRHFLTHQTIENSLRINTFRSGKSGQRASVERDVVEVGLIHQYHRLQQEPRDSTINNLMLTGRLGFRPGDRLSLVAAGRLNLADQLGDFQIDATGSLDLDRFGAVELRFFSQLAEPTVLQESYFLSGRGVYRNDFNKTLETRLSAAVTLPVVGIRAGVAYNFITDLVFADTLGIPRQRSGLVNVVQLTAERDFRFGAYGLDNRLLLQTTDADELRLPTFMGEHSLYYGGKWFGVLNVRLGVDVRYFASQNPYYYNPIFQSFQLQDRQETGFQLQTDLFFSMRVTRFRFFFKVEQFNTLWNPDLLYLVAEQPNPDQANRIGIRWRLVN